MDDKSLLTMLKKIIHDETKFLRTYTGVVLNPVDSFQKGRVLCSVMELVWTTEDIGVWAYPTDKNALVTPKKGDYVRIGFMCGDPDRPFYLGCMAENPLTKPQNYDGQNTTAVIWENNNGDTYMSYDELTLALTMKDASNEIKMDPSGITLQQGTEPFVLGNSMSTAFDTLLTALKTHIHPGTADLMSGVVTLSPPPTAASFTNPMTGNLSSTIKGK